MAIHTGHIFTIEIDGITARGTTTDRTTAYDLYDAVCYDAVQTVILRQDGETVASFETYATAHAICTECGRQGSHRVHAAWGR